MDKNAKIYVAGNRGLVGSALIRGLQARGYTNLVTRRHDVLDLRDQLAVATFFQQERPEYVFLAAARVGGIWANQTYPAEFIYDNLTIETNIIHQAYLARVRKLLFLGSSCIYPKHCPQPMKEAYILDGKLESTNEPYAIAKIAGIKMCQAYQRQYGARFISVMPTNLYGPGDNFDPMQSHVIPALIRKYHEAKMNGSAKVVIWGSGTPRREFLYVDDLADACIFLMQQYDSAEIINIGVGEDLSIKELARLIGRITGFEGELVFDPNFPDGPPRKLMDVSRLHDLGWRAKTSFTEGLERTYDWFLKRWDR
jgi:GDP-L-fucose synthase